VSERYVPAYPVMPYDSDREVDRFMHVRYEQAVRLREKERGPTKAAIQRQRERGQERETCFRRGGL
jgi:hypothetical protein